MMVKISFVNFFSWYAYVEVEDEFDIKIISLGWIWALGYGSMFEQIHKILLEEFYT
jgi:hypothetical protein